MNVNRAAFQNMQCQLSGKTHSVFPLGPPCGVVMLSFPGKPNQLMHLYRGSSPSDLKLSQLTSHMGQVKRTTFKQHSHLPYMGRPHSNTHQILCSDGLSRAAGPHNHTCQSVFHVLETVRQSQDSHNLTGHCDVEPSLEKNIFTLLKTKPSLIF